MITCISPSQLLYWALNFIFTSAKMYFPREMQEGLNQRKIDMWHNLGKYNYLFLRNRESSISLR